MQRFDARHGETSPSRVFVYANLRGSLACATAKKKLVVPEARETRRGSRRRRGRLRKQRDPRRVSFFNK